LIRQALLLAIAAAVLGLGINLFSPNRVDFIGKFRDLSGGDKPIVPPTADKDDPPFIAINEAQMEHATTKTLFVDARNPEEFDCGTIPGSINVPFEMLPEGDLGPYFDSVLAVPRDYPIVTFCSGEECDLSLHLARNMKLKGFTHVAIFFGGAREWEKFGLDMQRRKQCGK
jgi:rhodanese-related sulfurtransferase